MNPYEHIITPFDLSTRFKGEYDAVTHLPYRVGDHLVRCKNCHSLIKTEYIREACPLCNASPFNYCPPLTDNTAPVFPSKAFSQPASSEVPSRDKTFLAALLAFSVFLSIMPLFLINEPELYHNMLFGLSRLDAATLFIALGSVISVILYANRKIQTLWQSHRYGFFIPFIPCASIYGVILAIWITITVLAIAFIVMLFAAIIAIIGAFCS